MYLCAVKRQTNKIAYALCIKYDQKRIKNHDSYLQYPYTVLLFWNSNSNTDALPTHFKHTTLKTINDVLFSIQFPFWAFFQKESIFFSSWEGCLLFIIKPYKLHNHLK